MHMATATNVTEFGKMYIVHISSFTHLEIYRASRNITQQKCVGLKGSDKPPFKPGFKIAITLATPCTDFTFQ